MREKVFPFIAVIVLLVLQGCGSNESRTENTAPDASPEAQGECQNGLKECQGKTARTCVGGHWQETQACQFVCQDGNCLGECVAGQKQCQGLIPQTCVDSQWQNHAPCPFICHEGSCQGVCQPGSKRCQDQTPEKCSAQGQWTSEEPCSHQVCLEGICQGVCGPGDKNCDKLTPQTCGDAGQWVDGTDCHFLCDDGECTGLCAPDSKRCEGKKAQSCDATGKWTDITECPFNCENGVCTGACVSGSLRCNGQTPETCDAQGSWIPGTACPFICAEGACSGECLPQAKDCQDKIPRECDAQGQWQNKAACPFICQEGACTGECLPGEKQCLGNTAQTCGSSGVWSSTDCTASQASCCNGLCAPAVTKVVGGRSNTCALRTDGTLWCWGMNSSGAVGDGASSGVACNVYPPSICQTTPKQVASLGTDTKQFSVGGSHVCAVKKDDTLWCWGSNGWGQLSAGNTTGLPAQITELGDQVSHVEASENSTCTLKTDGSVWCWGRNNWGQLGNDSFGYLKHPYPLQAIPSGVVNLSARVAHACALKNDGTLWCWGYGRYGALGTLNLSDCLNYDRCAFTPIQVTNAGSGIAEVSTGLHHTCVRRNDNTGWCWGNNTHGELGIGTIVGSSSCWDMCELFPQQVTTLGTSVSQLSASYHNSCSLKYDGSLWCWGDNFSGQLGNGTNVGQSCENKSPCNPLPSQVPSFGTSVIDYTEGLFHACAIKNDGSLWCWGANTHGQLGDGTLTDRYSPVRTMCQP